MAVNYFVFQQKFDMSGNDSKKYYAKAQATGELTFKQLCSRISAQCTVTKADVMAVLEDGSYLAEWQWTREIALRIECALRADQVNVQRIVPEITDVPLWLRCARVNRIVAANGTENCLLLSLHVNASADGEARGWEVHTSKGRTVSDLYATLFWKEAEKQLTGLFKIRGDHSDGDPDWDSNFAILRDTSCPAVLTENLFMDNLEDCRFLLSDEGKKSIVQLHVKAIRKIVALQKYYQ